MKRAITLLVSLMVIGCFSGISVVAEEMTDIVEIDEIQTIEIPKINKVEPIEEIPKVNELPEMQVVERSNEKVKTVSRSELEFPPIVYIFVFTFPICVSVIAYIRGKYLKYRDKRRWKRDNIRM